MNTAFSTALLELTSQAVFAFGPDFRVRPEVSAACEGIFGTWLVGADAAELLWGPGAKAAEFREGLNLVFAGTTAPDVVFDLLEAELERSERRYHIDYRLLPDRIVLVVLTDITRERRFQEISRRDLERRFMVLKAVAHRRHFAAFMAEATALFDLLVRYEASTRSTAEWDDLRRAVHTFKGNARFFDFNATAAAAHDFESHLEELAAFAVTPEAKKHALALKQAYFPELRLIADFLGERWIAEADGVTIPRDKYLAIERWVRAKHSSDAALSRTLALHRLEPLRDQFAPFPVLAASLAERLGKAINPLIVEGGDFPVSPERWRSFVDVFGHLVRNAVDHGIEFPAAREAAGKGPAGNLRIQLSETDQHLSVSLSDDGRGIDCAALAERARRLGIDSGDGSEAHDMQLIFHPGLSTAAVLSDDSGRGLGLSAVQAEVDRLGGSIQVHSRPGRGTTFEITFPRQRQAKA